MGKKSKKLPITKRHSILYIPIYDVEVLVMRCKYSEIGDTLHWYHNTIPIDSFFWAHWCAVLYTWDDWVKWLATWLNEEADLWLVAHELYHTSVRVLKAKGIENNKHTEEVVAQLLWYIMSWYVKEFL